MNIVRFKIHIKPNVKLFTKDDIKVFSFYMGNISNSIIPIFDNRVMDGGKDEVINEYSAIYYHIYTYPNSDMKYYYDVLDRRVMLAINNMGYKPDDLIFSEEDKGEYICKPDYKDDIEFCRNVFTTNYSFPHYMYLQYSEALINTLASIHIPYIRSTDIFSDSPLILFSKDITTKNVYTISSTKDLSTFAFVDTIQQNASILENNEIKDRQLYGLTIDEYKPSSRSLILLGYDYATNLIIFKKLYSKLLKFSEEIMRPVIVFPIPIFQEDQFIQDVKDKYTLINAVRCNNALSVIYFSV